MATHFANIDAVAKASLQDLMNVDEVGDVVAESIYEYFQNADNLETISRLKAAGLKFEMDSLPEKLSETLAGKTIVISGNFSISRDAMKALITAHGGKNSGSISGKTSYLLAGEKPGPEKIKKAETLGIQIIDEETFNGMIQ